MQVASQLARRAVARSLRSPIAIRSVHTRLQRPVRVHQLQRTSQRGFANPIAPSGKYNGTPSFTSGHGLWNYLKSWEALVFCHDDLWKSTFWIWSSSLFSVGVMFYIIWNSACRDPESTLRPHKRAWHRSDEKLARGELYRGGGFIWYPMGNRNGGGNRSRVDFIRKIHREGLGVAGFNEPGQDGYAENPIPSLDDGWQANEE